MNVLFLGDIVGRIGRQSVKFYLNKIIEKYSIDFVIANAENATHGKGLILKHYNELIDSGVDCITLGNHYDNKSQIFTFIDDAEYLVRPLNLLKTDLGKGSRLFNVNGVNIRVTNVLGTAFMHEEVKNPYQSIKELLEEIKCEDSIHIIDFHAEATGEKICLGYAFDGLVSAILGTHTHVQTNDCKILPEGTGYCSDAGMCGAANSVLGFEKNSVINKTLFGNKSIFEIDDNDKKMINGIVISIDDNTYLATNIFPIKMIED